MSDDMSIEQILMWPEMADVLEELNDARYFGRRHGSRATYAKKCHGPLCRMAEKLRAQRRRAEVAARQGREYQEGAREYDRDDLLIAVITWHKRKLLNDRLDREEAS